MKQGEKMSETQRAAMSASLKGRKISEKTRLSRIGRKMPMAVKVKISEALKGRPKSFEHRAKIGAVQRSPEMCEAKRQAMLGRKHSVEHRRKTKENHAKYWQGKTMSVESNAKRSKSMMGKTHAGLKGSKNPNWIKDRRYMCSRNTDQYKQWRLQVYKRDGFTCQSCGQVGGNNLHAHHILSFAKYPDVRFDINNGITLCFDCHSELHGRKVGVKRA